MRKNQLRQIEVTHNALLKRRAPVSSADEEFAPLYSPGRKTQISPVRRFAFGIVVVSGIQALAFSMDKGALCAGAMQNGFRHGRRYRFPVRNLRRPAACGVHAFRLFWGSDGAATKPCAMRNIHLWGPRWCDRRELFEAARRSSLDICICLLSCRCSRCDAYGVGFKSMIWRRKIAREPRNCRGGGDERKTEPFWNALRLVPIHGMEVPLIQS